SLLQVSIAKSGVIRSPRHVEDVLAIVGSSADRRGPLAAGGRIPDCARRLREAVWRNRVQLTVLPEGELDAALRPVAATAWPGTSQSFGDGSESELSLSRKLSGPGSRRNRQIHANFYLPHSSDCSVPVSP